MAYIYQIENDINEKKYIGKTELSIEKRFKQHCKDAFKETCSKRPLYSAMKKYGLNHFHLSLIEETDNPEEREKYWIEYFGTFKNGYNATLGGDGKAYIDYDLVISTYKELKIISQVAKKLNIDKSTIEKILNSHQIDKTTQKEAVQITQGIIINQYDLNNNFIKSYPSARSAAMAIGKITQSSNGAADHILSVCKGKRKTAYGFIWKYGI